MSKLSPRIEKLLAYYAAVAASVGIMLVTFLACSSSKNKKDSQNDFIETDTVWVLRKKPGYASNTTFTILGNKNNKIYAGKFIPVDDPILASAEIGDKLVITDPPASGKFTHFTDMKAVKNLTAEAQLKEFANQR